MEWKITYNELLVSKQILMKISNATRDVMLLKSLHGEILQLSLKYHWVLKLKIER